MPKELKIILRETPVGLEPTSKQLLQREKFTRVVKEVAQEMKDSKLKGAAKVKAFNTKMSQHLQEPELP